MPPRPHYAYFVRCADGTLYAGYARDPWQREEAHNDGRGARYTAGRRPVRLVYCEAFRSKGAALRREYRLKQLSRARKEALIAAGPGPPDTVRASPSRYARRQSASHRCV